jgi:hypothetical protein
MSIQSIDIKHKLSYNEEFSFHDAVENMRSCPKTDLFS